MKVEAGSELIESDMTISVGEIKLTTKIDTEKV